MKIIFTVVCTAVLGLVLLLSYYGLFTKINIGEEKKGPFWLVYEKHIGDYAKTGLVMDDIYDRLLREDSLETKLGFGLYYDNPKEVDKQKLRSIVGCILDQKDENQIQKLKGKYKIAKYPETRSLVAEFPFKGKMSIFMGIFKFYPKLTRILAEKNVSPVPVMEIYDCENKKIVYVASVLMKPEDFNVYL